VNADLFNLTFRKPEYVDKQRLLRRLDKAWVAFKDSYAGLSESDVLEPGVTKAWSVRDIIAHVTTWEEEVLKHLPAILEGRRPPLYSVTLMRTDPMYRPSSAPVYLALSECSCPAQAPVDGLRRSARCTSTSSKVGPVGSRRRRTDSTSRNSGYASG
jgi:hypothetical protein